MRPSTLRALTLAVALFGLGLPALASAQFKVGFVDQRRAIISSKEGKDAEKTLSALQEKKKGEMQPQQQQCLKQREEIEAQRFVLSEEAIEERVINMRRCERELERDLQAARDELAIQERKHLGPIVKNFETAVKEIGKGQKFDMILDRASPGVLYFQDALDITDLVIKRLNGS